MSSNQRVASRRERQNFESLIQQDRIKSAQTNKERNRVNSNQVNLMTPNYQQPYNQSIQTPMNNNSISNNSNLNQNQNKNYQNLNSNTVPTPQVQKMNKPKNFKTSKRDLIWEEKRQKKSFSRNEEISNLNYGNKNNQQIPERLQNTTQNYTPMSNIVNSNNYGHNMINREQQENYNQSNYPQGPQSKVITPYVNPQVQNLKTPSGNYPLSYPNNQNNYGYSQNYPVPTPSVQNKNYPLQTPNNQIGYSKNYSMPTPNTQNNMQHNQRENTQTPYNNSVYQGQAQGVSNQVQVQTPNNGYQNQNFNNRYQNQTPLNNNISVQNNYPNARSQSSTPFNYNFSSQNIQNQNPYQRSNSVTPTPQQVYGNNTDRRFSQTPMSNYNNFPQQQTSQQIRTPYSNYPNQQINSGVNNYSNQISTPLSQNYQSNNTYNYQKPPSSQGNKPFSNISFKNENSNHTNQIYSYGFERQNSVQSMYLGRENKKFIYQ
jgi:hypothetical protein